MLNTMGVFGRFIVISAAMLTVFSPLLTAAPNSDETGAPSADEIIRADVYVIPLREDVDRYLGVFLGRSLEKAEEAGAELVIIEIDTFGGRVDTALEIASRIGSVNWAKTAAYVPADSGGRGVSWSAGALMAFSASEIWMAPGTSMGAAAPVLQSAEGVQDAGEKTVSALRGQMAALAEKNGYPVEVALAMVDSDVVLKEVTVNGKERLAAAEDIEIMQRRGESVEIVVGKTVSAEGKLLTLTAGEMERYGVSSGTTTTRDELIRSYGYSLDDVVVLEKNRSDSVIAFLTSGAITSLLLGIALVTLYLEITSPGFGVTGTIALICLALVFGASGLMGNLGPVEILLLLAGIVLLLLEIFVIPGFGVAGIAGIALILASLVFSMQDFYWPRFDWQWTIARRNFVVVGAGLLGGLILIGVVMATLPRAGLFDRLVLKGPGDPGYAGSPRRRPRRGRRGSNGDESGSEAVQRAGLSRAGGPSADGGEGSRESGAPAGHPVGAEGTAVTDLRPVGKVKFNGRVVVAETDGEYYDKGTRVVVQFSDGVKVVVTAEE